MACNHCRKRKAKCDGARPSCSLCVRLKRPCEYEAIAAKRGPKKRNVKELEDRIASMEAQLNANRTTLEDHSNTQTISSVDDTTMVIDDTSFLNDMEALQPGDDSFFPLAHNDANIEVFTIGHSGDSSNGATSYTTPSVEYQFRDLVSLGHHGGLPDDTTIDTLTKIYFSDIHPCLPIIHEARYYMNINLNTSHRPALCLQYAMWALAAKHNDSFAHLADYFQRKSRMYLEEDELMDQDSSFLTVSHVQCWALLTYYAAMDLSLTRAWMNVRRATAIAQLLKLHALDRAPPSMAKSLPEARDFAELEERRRTFWVVFCYERWTSGGSGNPITIKIDDVLTDLPCSDQSFLLNISESTQTFQDALENGLAPSASGLSAFVIQSSLLDRSMRHTNTIVDKNEVSDAERAKFWEEHHALDNSISIALMSRSQHIHLAGNSPDPLLLKFISGLHAMTLALHQTAIRFIEKFGGDESQIARSKTRCKQKSDDIIDLVRSIAHVDPKKWYPFTVSCLHAAALEFLQNYQEGHEKQMNLEKLRFAIKSLQLVARNWKSAELFVKFLSNDLIKSGIDIQGLKHSNDVPNIPAATMLKRVMNKASKDAA